MRLSIIVVCVAILAGPGATNVCSFGQTVSRTTRVSAQSAPKRQGFFDYALGKINPEDKDYGATLESRRSSAVENSIDDLYFWSNVVALVLVCVLAAIVLLQWRAADKREVIAASLIAQLWNGRVSDRIEIERRTAEFNRLVEAHNVEVERSLAEKPTDTDLQAEEAGKLTKSVRNLVGGERKASAPRPARADTARPTVPDAQTLSVEQNNILLQHRVEALQNSEQNLRERLNQTTVLLDQERRRNATLKGA